MNVTVFSSTNCAICHALMLWLDKEHVPYKNIVIDESDDNMDKLIEATDGAVQGTPVTLVANGDDKTIISGFDRAALQTALGIG